MHHPESEGNVGAGAAPPARGPRPLPFLLAIYVPVLCVLGACIVVSRATGVPFSQFSRDASEILNFPFYLGVLSNLGILAWSASAAICFFAAAVPVPGEFPGERKRLLLVTGFLTSWFVLDDLLTLHEIVLPGLLGVRQRYVLAAYLVLMVLYLVRFRAILLKSDALLLATALAFFGLSVVSDVIQSRFPLPGDHYIEDGSKLLGIAGWSAYFIRTAMRHVRGMT